VPITDAKGLLGTLLAATTPAAVRAALEQVGDHADVELDRPFGPLDLRWCPFGNNLSNFSTIGLARHPGRSLTERLTNAADAILEDRRPTGVSPPNSPRDAAQQWFGRPVSGPDDGLFNWNPAGLDRRICVVLSESGAESTSTVDVLDEGVGIAPSDFPGTILSLQSGNKINKRYLIGSFGQGGASTLAFCDYAVIVSRPKAHPRTAGFTVIRVLKLDESYKEDCYAYLAMSGADGRLAAPSCQVEDGALAVYPARGGVRLPSLSKGTMVRHVSYRLPKLAGKLGPDAGNLYHFLHLSAFDPLLPFRVIDLREAGKEKDELVTGNRNRLMRLVQRQEAGAEGRTEIRHHRPMEFFTPPDSHEPCIGIEYWVVLAYRKGRGKEKDQLVLRAQSNSLFMDAGHPIIGTLNGQNQGERTAALLKDVGLGMVSRHIVIHIDATSAGSQVRKRLFTTTREGFKEETVLFSLEDQLREMLKEDEALFEVERELTERLAKREATETRDAVKRQVAKLLQEAGLEVRKEGPSAEPGEGEKRIVQTRRSGRHTKLDPLPTKPYPQVTRFEIVVPAERLNIHLGDSEMVLVETDADSEFFRRGDVRIRSEPPALEVVWTSPLRGGRVRWRLRPAPSAKAQDKGNVVVTLTKPDGAQLQDQVEYEVLPALEAKTKPSQGYVPEFDIVGIHPEDYAEQWNQTWPEMGEDATLEQMKEVAYRAVKGGKKITVFYSLIFPPFQEVVDKLKTTNQTLLDLFTSQYEVWIGYHAILQENRRPLAPDGVEQESLEKLLDAERAVVARMQVKQAMQVAELIRKSVDGQQGE
jgi:hypothetical protein